MPSFDQQDWGWSPPVRGLLTILAGLVAIGLTWVSREERVGLMALPSLSVDANSAPGPVLTALPGLGPTLAARIVEARPFRSMDDFDRRVKGIGPAKVAALRPFLRFEPPSDPIPSK